MGTKTNPGKYDCLSKAESDEPTFTLLGRDPIASFCVTLWASLNRELNKGEAHCEDKNEEALACADAMAEWARERGKAAEMDRVADVFFEMLRRDNK